MTISTLVVDDNANTRADIGSSFDLLIIDHKMPLMDGLTLLKNLRQLGQYHHTPILFVTTQDVTEVEPLALKHGATRCLSKPLQAQFLCDVVSYYTKRSVA